MNAGLMFGSVLGPVLFFSGYSSGLEKISMATHQKIQRKIYPLYSLCKSGLSLLQNVPSLSNTIYKIQQGLLVVDMAWLGFMDHAINQEKEYSIYQGAVYLVSVIALSTIVAIGGWWLLKPAVNLNSLLNDSLDMAKLTVSQPLFLKVFSILQIVHLLFSFRLYSAFNEEKFIRVTDPNLISKQEEVQERDTYNYLGIGKYRFLPIQIIASALQTAHIYHLISMPWIKITHHFIHSIEHKSGRYIFNPGKTVTGSISIKHMIAKAAFTTPSILESVVKNLYAQVTTILEGSIWEKSKEIGRVSYYVTLSEKLRNFALNRFILSREIAEVQCRVKGARAVSIISPFFTVV